MEHSNKAGFTIIETMLFLGITGLLVMGVLVGTGGSISLQRYRDSVVSLQTFLQQQYSYVENISNLRSDNLSCDDSGVKLESSVGIPRGQSDCVILGRLITSDANNNNELIIKNIIGLQSNLSVDNDIVAINNYNIMTDALSSIENYQIQWGATISKGTGSSSDFSILIIRSPMSGAIKTFIDPSHRVSTTEEIRGLVSLGNLGSDKNAKVCVDPNGLSVGNKMAVLIKSNTSSASAVEVLGDASSGCK